MNSLIGGSQMLPRLPVLFRDHSTMAARLGSHRPIASNGKVLSADSGLCLRCRARSSAATAMVNSISNRHDTTLVCSSDSGKIGRSMFATGSASRPIKVSALSVGTFQLSINVQSVSQLRSLCRWGGAVLDVEPDAERHESPFDLRSASPCKCDSTMTEETAGFVAMKKSQSRFDVWAHRYRISVVSNPTTHAAITAAVIQPIIVIHRDKVNLAITRVSLANFIITTIIGAAITPLMTALQ